MRLLPRDKEISFIPYIWLIYLSYIPMYCILAGVGAKVWTVSLLSIVIFLPLYFRGYWVKGNRLLWVVALIALLGTLLSPINLGASVYFIYAAAFAGEAQRPRYAAVIVAALVLIIAAETVVFHLASYFWIPGILFTIIIGAVDIHFAERRRENAKLRMAHEEVERMAQIAERERISRDLHDVLGHTLSVIVLKSELASKLADKDPQRAAQEIRDVERISRETLAQVRSTVRGYQSRGLMAELDQAKSALQAAGVAVHCDLSPTGLAPSHEGVLALALREAVTNVIRHADASSCNLNLSRINGFCRLEIADNGNGKPGPEGVGLSGMRTRVEALGGALERETGSGTRLIIILPLVSK